MREAAEGLFEGDHAEVTAIRFEESAYVLSKSNRLEDAQVCLAAARAFRETPAGENPIAQALLEESLGSFLQNLRDKEEKGAGDGGDEPLIVTP